MMRLLFTLINGEEIDYSTEQDSVTIGRSSKCDVVIPHESMSRQHCKIELKDGEVFITDLGSINGVYIDGIKIAANSSVPFYTYLHLAFGFVTNTQLVIDENTRQKALTPDFKHSQGNSPSQENSTEPSHRTKTKAVQPEKAKQIKGKKPNSETSEKSALLIKGLAFVAILVAIYFLLYGDNINSGDQSQTDSERINRSEAF